LLRLRQNLRGHGCVYARALASNEPLKAYGKRSKSGPKEAAIQAGR
jgi:hypothetical protein